MTVVACAVNDGFYSPKNIVGADGDLEHIRFKLYWRNQFSLSVAVASSDQIKPKVSH